MKLFGSLFKSSPTVESKAAIDILKKWEKDHFAYRHYKDKSSDGEQQEIDFSVYITESGDRISLSDMRSPLDKS